MDRHELALTQYRKGLEVNPRNLIFRREEAFSLNRLGRADEAIVRIENLLQDTPNDGETIAYLGRIYKEMWYQSWKRIPDKEARLKAAFDSYHWLIKSFETYLRGYRCDLNRPDAYPGVNALTLGRVLIHLADRYDDPKAPDPEIQWVRSILPGSGRNPDLLPRSEGPGRKCGLLDSDLALRAARADHRFDAGGEPCLSQGTHRLPPESVQPPVFLGTTGNAAKAGPAERLRPGGNPHPRR